MSERILPAVLAALLAFVLVSSTAPAETLSDPKGDASGTLEEALSAADIVEVRADAVGSDLAVALLFASDPYPYLRENPSAEHHLRLDISAADEKGEKRSVVVRIVYQAGSVPEVECEPEEGALVFDFYEVGTGYQMRMDVVEPPAELALKASAEISDRGKSARDETDSLSVPVREKGKPAMLPPAVKAPPEPAKRDRKLNVEEYRPPKGGYGPSDDEQYALQELEAARKALAEGDKAAVWEHAEEAILNAAEYATKFAARDLIYKAGPITPEPLTDSEKARVRRCIGGERIRYYRELEPASEQGKIALERLILKTAREYGIGGTSERKITDMEEKFLKDTATAKDPAADEAEAKGLKAMKAAAEKAEAAGKLATAYRILYRYVAALMAAPAGKRPESVSSADKRLKALGRKLIAAVPAADRKLMRDAVNHPAWKRITVFPTRHFIFIVPEPVKKRIKRDSIMRLDVAFTFEADFFSVSTSKYNVRITVFLKELWGFRGGTGGGSQINIGYKWAVENHNPAAVDSMLYTHEMGHCMTVGRMLFMFPGFIEGVANLAMVMAEDCIGRHASAKRSIESQIKLGTRYYINGNLAYWMVQNYAPSFTVMAGLVAREPLVAGAFDWAKMRGALRDFMNFPIKPRSLFQYAWAWVKSLEPYFGDKVYDYYRLCRFPLAEDSREVLQDDLDFYNAELAMASFEGPEALLGLLDDLEKHNPRSYYRQLVMLKLLEEADATGDEDLREEMIRKLGLVREAMVLGPYSEKWDYMGVLEPEKRIDLQGEYRTYRSVVRWKRERADAAGFFARKSGYRGHWSGYVLCYVKVPEDTPARLWVRSRRGFAAWVNGRVVHKVPRFIGKAWDTLSDFAFFDITLRKGWNRLLGRFSFNFNEGLMRMRLTDRDGNAIEGLEFSVEDHEADIPPLPRAKDVVKVFSDDFEKSTLSRNRWRIGSGKFTVKKGALLSENGRARRFRWTVVPAERKDPDPAIVWTKCRNLWKHDGYRVELKVRHPRKALPEMYITLDGEGDENICSGASIHLSVSRSTLSWLLCHYDFKFYAGSTKEVKAATEHVITVQRLGDLYSLSIDGVTLFENLSLPEVKQGQVGLAWMKDGPQLDEVTITTLKAAKGKRRKGK